jgi:catechol 2,3-dioxygenase-like lactoylglutathione lyase family enzyme
MSATFRLDHVVIRVRDLEEACADYRALGFTVTPGGEHPTLGTRNALIPFEDDTYLELIAFPPREVPADAQEKPVHGRWRRWEAASEGLVDFALVPSDVGEAIREARARGLEIAGPFPGSRRRPDGQEVAWQLGIPETFDLPFLCADVTPRELRVPAGEARKHANGVVGIIGIGVWPTDFTATLDVYLALLGTMPRIHQPPVAVFRAPNISLRGEASMRGLTLSLRRQPRELDVKGHFELLDKTRAHGADITVAPNV